MIDLITTGPNRNTARSIMLFEANKKSLLISYIFWFFFGCLGGHRFYNGRIGSALAIAALTLVGIFLSSIGIGIMLFFVVIVWVFVDVFLIPGWIKSYNNLLALQLAEEN